MGGKQAKTISPMQEKMILSHLKVNTRLTEKNMVLFLLSMKAGLRAKEIANLVWSDVLDSGGNVSDVIVIRDKISKGGYGGRKIPMNKTLKEALVALWAIRRNRAKPDWKVIYSQQNSSSSANSVTVWFHNLYKNMGIEGASSHTGRRTFITNAARKISTVGGSLRDIQSLAGHSNIATTQRYIDVNENAKKQIVDII